MVDKPLNKCYYSFKGVIATNNDSVAARIRQVREAQEITRKEFAARLGTTADEIRNVECDRLKRPEQKESLYRSIATEFGVSLEWIKTGDGNMYGTGPQDQIAQAFGQLAARHDPVIDGFIRFLQTRTPEQVSLIAQQLRDCVDFIAQEQESTKED